MKRVESEAGRECEEKEIGDSYCTDGPTGPEGGEVSSEGTNEDGGEGEGDRGLVDGGREVESERSDSTTHGCIFLKQKDAPEIDSKDAIYFLMCIIYPSTDGRLIIHPFEPIQAKK
ncbi:hypothetical protein ACOMHN_025153 [Nucella lapillus]